MRKILMILTVCILVLSGCTGIIHQSDFEEITTEVDWGLLFGVVEDLASDQYDDNIEGLDALGEVLGKDITGPTLKWYNVAMLAAKAGAAIYNGIKSRDPQITEIINEYERRSKL